MTLFRKWKTSTLRKNNFGRYLTYVIGEILLVVVGILIALSINNWSERRQQEGRLRNIFLTFEKDIDNDIADIDRVLDYYGSNKEAFQKIMNGEMNKRQFKECGDCTFLITGHNSFIIEVRGYEALKSFNSAYDEDSLVNQIVQSMTASIENISSIDDLIRASITKDLESWRDQYDWFSQFAQENITDEYIEFAITDQTYRNQASWRFILIYGNYVREVEKFRQQLVSFKEAIEERLNN
ncbi:DUF6090 family protein [Roseivirga sp. E12]|uniref:DUF6090 family protein n=1 Tax=Roseivirga sp. E12 TaxID=2819237 RepID=UPI001ABCDF02|nr:DUF6090 family protein [Roseivirga sp. E12]MBO3697201.1 hypothetical protein [Roseivirga sp. E12]